MKIKALIIGMAAMLAIEAKTQTTNDIHIFTGIEWSTNNGVTWAKDLTPADTFDEVVGGAFAPSFTDNVYFFQLQIVQLQDTRDTNYTAVTYNILQGTNVYGATNFMEDAQAIVSPSRILHTNIIYRPWITITNYLTGTPFVSTNTFPDNTNPPPSPIVGRRF